MIEPLRTTSRLGPLLTLLVACSAAPRPEARAPAADAGAKLERATKVRAKLETQLAATPKDIRAICQTTNGDCLISLAERREALVSKYYLNACRDPDADKQGPCIVHELEQRREQSELASFYETENWCTQKLLECMNEFANNAEKMAARQRTQDRRAQVEAAPESAIADRAPEFAKEKLDFVRAILPPPGQNACVPDLPEKCSKTLDAPNAAFEAELAAAPASYDPKRALTLYAAIQHAEAECRTPEFNCLLDQMPHYGGNPESDKLLKQNLSMIADQQKIRAVADPEAAEQCISAGVTQHSSRIVSAYQAYAAAPSPTLFVRLQKAFIAMHQAQLWCLTPLGKASKR